jgi:hypothetical protein
MTDEEAATLKKGDLVFVELITHYPKLHLRRVVGLITAWELMEAMRTVKSWGGKVTKEGRSVADILATRSHSHPLSNDLTADDSVIAVLLESERGDPVWGEGKQSEYGTALFSASPQAVHFPPSRVLMDASKEETLGDNDDDS